jgi:hypothetical protein
MTTQQKTLRGRINNYVATRLGLSDLIDILEVEIDDFEILIILSDGSRKTIQIHDKVVDERE